MLARLCNFLLHARNILALDPNGLSDPFVLIELSPHHVFPRQSVQQTQIVKNSLNPTFDESFEFSVSRQQCLRNGACIVFTVMDHDFMLANDFAGEVYLSLSSIPGITGGDISGFTALKPITLPLMQPRKGEKTKATAALTAMHIRDWDKDAQEFVKKRRQIEAQSQN
ncbi:BAI1-associated protein 3 [Lamellibrachia satsuma]|nr:BAI1-associated protein 3 [Lamellibrachia satsuma]